MFWNLSGRIVLTPRGQEIVEYYESLAKSAGMMENDPSVWMECSLKYQELTPYVISALAINDCWIDAIPLEFYGEERPTHRLNGNVWEIDCDPDASYGRKLMDLLVETLLPVIAEKAELKRVYEENSSYIEELAFNGKPSDWHGIDLENDLFD